MNKHVLPELLAPAGDIDCLKAAVYAGADAVYFGCPKYNARAFAGNFGEGTIDEAVKLCRIFGVKIYITFNTLASEKEFSEMRSYAVSICEKYKPDGIIVQDIGLANEISKAVGTPIVASTQMAQHSARGAEFLKKLGVFRIVAAREMTLADVKKMQDESGLESELFIHGAICVCQSGGCLMSSLIGKRSGNKGECAQPCRLPYNNGYPLSLKDMCLARHIKDIIAAKISSLKIEGRMKSPEYVYAVTSIYRKLLDENRNTTDSEVEFLEAVFSRSGFTDAFITGKLSSEMFGVRTDADKEKTSNIAVKIDEKKLPVQIKAKFTETASSMEIICGKYTACAVGDVPQRAQSKPLTREDLQSRLSKLGDTLFAPTSCEVEVCGELFMPIGAINALRRSCIEKLENAIIAANTPIFARKNNEFCRKKIESENGLIVRLCGKNIPSPTLFEKLEREIKFFDVPLWRCGELSAYAQKYGKKVRALMPRCVYPEDEENISNLVKSGKEMGIGGILCSGFAQKSFAQGLPYYADFTANANNRESAFLYASEGFSGLCASPELSAGAIRAIKDVLPISVIAYGRIPLMHTRSCIVESASKRICARDLSGVCSTVLTDRMGAKFPVIREYGHRSTIYNSVPIWLLDKEIDVSRVLIFTDESDEKIASVCRDAISGAKPSENITRAYF